MQSEPTFDYFLNSSTSRKREKKKELEIYTIAEFSKSNAIILTDCYVLNHWFLALIQAHGYEMFQWLLQLQNLSTTTVNAMLTVPYIWFAKEPRKPPDKCSGTKMIMLFMTILEYITDILQWLFATIEDVIFNMTNKSVSINYLIFISKCFFLDANQMVIL